MMKLSKLDMVILSTFIEHISLNEKICRLNKKGVKRLALIQSKMAAEILNINYKDILDICEKNLFENLKTKEDGISKSI